MDETNLFGQRIYELRKQKQLNQKQLGEAVDLSHKGNQYYRERYPGDDH